MGGMSDERPRYISVPSACQRIGGDKPIHRSTYYRGVKAGIFPGPFHISPNIARVDVELLDEAIEARKSVTRGRSDPQS
jgi:hypothetical protein